MSKQNNPALTLDANGKSYLYGTHLSCGCVPRFTVRLSGPVDGSALQRAADHALERYPQMAVGVAQDKSNYFFIPIDLPAPVFEGDGSVVRRMGTEDTNAYLFCISYEGNTVHADWFHALADGLGFIVFLKSILYYYMKETGLPVENDGSIRDESTSFEEEEAEDAVLNKLPENGRDAYPRFPAYRVPDVSTSGDPEDTVVQIRLPFQKLRGIVKEYKASPVTFICPLFSAAIYEKHCADGEYETPIIAAIPVNMRPYYPSKTTRNFISCAGIPYDKKMSGLSFEAILNVEKGLLDFQTPAHELAYDAKKNAVEILELLDSDLSVEEKCRIMAESIEQTSGQTTYIITNLGKISFPPSMEPYIEEIYPCLPTALNPFTLAVVSYNDELVINVAQRHTDTDVCERFINILNELEIPAYISKVFNFHTMRYGA